MNEKNKRVTMPKRDPKRAGAQILKELLVAIEATKSHAEHVKSLVASLPQSSSLGGLPTSIRVLFDLLVLVEQLAKEAIIPTDNIGKGHGPGGINP